MKTKNLMMMAATLLVAGCSQNEITEMNPDADKAIGFGVYTGVQTKGTETTTTTLQGNGVGFGVVALDAGKTAVYMDERQVTYSSGSWTYTPAAFWPADGSALNFYSFAPYNGAGITKTSFASTHPTIGFAIQDDWNAMVDLVAAKKENVSSGTQVSLQFQHVLTRVAFTAKTSVALAAGTTVAVTGLEFLGNNINSGSCFYESGDYSILNDSWSNTTAKTGNYAVALAGGSVNVTAADVSLLGTDKYLYCIPVTGLGDGKIKVKLTYTITSNGVPSTKTETVSIPVGHFVKGTAYTYAFTITMNSISFTVTDVSGWGNGGSHDL